MLAEGGAGGRPECPSRDETRPLKRWLAFLDPGRHQGLHFGPLIEVKAPWCQKTPASSVLHIVKGTMTAIDGGTRRPNSVTVSRNASEFELLFYEHYESVLRVLTRLMANRAIAEEIANDVFWRLSRQSEQWLATANVAPWLYRTAMNAGIDVLRAAAKRLQYEREAGHPSASGNAGPLEKVLREDERRRVQSVLSRMKPQRAEMLVMRSCDWSQREIAAALAIAVGSVGTLLSRAEQEFRTMYEALVQKEAKRNDGCL